MTGNTRLIGRLAAILALIVLICLAAGPALAADKVIRVLNWQGYGSDEAWATKQFEEETGYKVVHDYFTSEEELLTKLRTAPGSYDAVLPNVAYLTLAIAEDLLDPIDTAKMENWKDLMPRFKEMAKIRKDGKVYGIPWTWGATAMVYNSEKFPNGVDSMAAMWDSKNKGNVGWWDSFEDSTVMVGIALGDKAPYHPSDLEAVKKKIMELMPNVKTLWSSEDQFNKLFANGDITLGHLLERRGLAGQEQNEAAHGVRGAQRGRHRLDRHLVPGQKRPQQGNRSQVDRLHDQPKVLRQVGHYRGLSHHHQHCDPEPATRGFI